MFKRCRRMGLALAAGMSILLVEAPTVSAGNSQHSETRQSRLAGFNASPTCRRMRRHIKAELIDAARRHCVSSHGSSGLRRVRNRRFTVIRCVRNGSLNSHVRMRMTWRCQ